MAGAATVAPSLLQPPLLLPLSLTSVCRGPSCRPLRRRRTNKVSHRTSITAQIELKPPPYSLDSLEPYMSHQTLEYHWGRHHRSHVEALNRQIKGTELDEVQLEDIMLTSYNNGDPLPAFNDAAQIWNHEQFWHSMKPGGGGRPSGTLLELIERDFGSFELMVEEFKRTAASQFGSGWVWFTYKANKLNVGNAMNPHPSEKDNMIVVAKSPNAPLLAVDVWEHAYYLDYENRRVDYISTFIDKLVAWDVVSSRLDLAIARAAERAKQEESTGVEENKDDSGEDEVREMYLDSENESEAE